ncbi:MAG: type II toxin-antitoxin system prevent-host-death family antitoxin [Phycisphaerales bacterium JB060]
MAERRRQLQDAKSRFSDVVRDAERGDVTIVTRRGVDTAVVIGIERYREVTRPRMSILDTLRGAPDMDAVPLDRRDDDGRVVDLDS